MNISETLEFIQSVSWLGCRPGLGRITDLMHRLGDPQDDMRYIHITGTNGKGSTAAMLSSILIEAGYTVGLFTSPHLLRYNERVKINGRDISDADLCAAAEAVKAAVEQMEETPSEFERFTAIALWFFRQRKCDLVVLEVGMGGELDATNVIPPPVAAIITRISLEHTEYLGNTLKEIAATKAGIIKPGTDVVLCEQSEAVTCEIQAKCAVCGARLTVTDSARLSVVPEGLKHQRLDYRNRKGLALGLPGAFQSKNAAVALDTVDVLRSRGWDIPEAAIHRGLSAVSWPGRFEILNENPLIILDGAHNPNGVEELAKCLRDVFPGGKWTFLMGVMSDKNYEEMLDTAAPLSGEFITVTPDSPRALSACRLGECIQRRLGLPVRSAEGIEEGLTLALGSGENAVCVFGSLYMAGEIRLRFPSVFRKWQRKRCIQNRNSLPPEARMENSAHISQQILASPEFARAKCILSYIAVKGEADLSEVHAQAKALGKTVVYPYCVSGSEMEALLPNGPDAWASGRYGIPAPLRERSLVILPEEIDLVLCPCSGFDEQCHRMGMGAGYYDRFLPLCRNADVVAVAFEVQKQPCIAVSSWDYPMKKIFTESAVYCAGGKSDG